MPVPTHAFVGICDTVRRLIKTKLSYDRISTGKTAIQKMDTGDARIIGAADKALAKELIRIRKVATQSAELRKAKKIELPKVHIDAYEKHLSLMVKKHGADLKNKNVKRSYDALIKELDRLVLEHYNITARLKRALKDHKSFVKIIKTLKEAWSDLAKAFLAAASTASATPMTSGLSPMLWGNMQLCSQIAVQMGKFESNLIAAQRIMKSGQDDAADRLHFLGQNLELAQKKSYLQTV